MDSTKIKSEFIKLVAQEKTLLLLPGSTRISQVLKPPMAMAANTCSVTMAMDL